MAEHGDCKHGGSAAAAPALTTLPTSSRAPATAVASMGATVVVNDCTWQHDMAPLVEMALMRHRWLETDVYSAKPYNPRVCTLGPWYELSTVSMRRLVYA